MSPFSTTSGRDTSSPYGSVGGLISRWRDRLPVSSRTPIITLGEGGTPLVQADRVAKAAGLPPGSVFLKIEGANPTG